MLITHLRRNAVAYLALFVALSTGTAYAAGQLGKNTVGTKQLKKNAVVSKKVKDGSLTLADLAPFSVTGAQVQDGSLGSADLAAGVLPGKATMAFTSFGSSPTATPDDIDVQTQPFTAAAAGTALVQVSLTSAGQNCSSGAAEIGLYLDGVPVSGSLLDVQSLANARPEHIGGTVSVTAGSHVLTLGRNCPSGSLLTGDFQVAWISAVVAPS